MASKTPIEPIYTLEELPPEAHSAYANVSVDERNKMKAYGDSIRQLKAERARQQAVEYEMLMKKIPAFMSAVGSGLQFIPNKYANYIGYALQAPDLINDGINYIVEPSEVNFNHLANDLAGFVPLKVIKNNISINKDGSSPNSSIKDYSQYLGIPGMVDDGYTAFTGKDIYDIAPMSSYDAFVKLRHKLQTISSNKQDTKKSIKNTNTNSMLTTPVATPVKKTIPYKDAGYLGYPTTVPNTPQTINLMGLPIKVNSRPSIKK